MAQITGGKIYYSQTRQAAQFEPKKAEVELSFIVGEGEKFEDIAKLAEDFAINKVQEMIGAIAAPAVRAVKLVTPKPAVDTTTPPPANSKEAYAAKEANVKKDAAAAPKTSVPKAGPKADKPAISTGEERVDPADVGTSDDDLLGVVETVTIPAAKTITDQDISSAITKVNQVINNPVALRALVATFVDPPKGSRDIPQEQRQAFLDKLNAMKK